MTFKNPTIDVSVCQALEACFGAEATNLWNSKMKKAMHKCSGIESPELDFPMFKDPARMINALMMGVKEREKAKLMEFVGMAAGNQKPTHHFGAPAQMMTLVPYPMQSMSQKQHSGDEHFIMKRMQTMMMKMMMNKLVYDVMTVYEDMEEDYEYETMNSSFDTQVDFENILEGLTERSNRRHVRKFTYLIHNHYILEF